MSESTVTVTKKGKRYVAAYSKLPGKTFGPFDLPEMVRDLRVAALLSPMDARNLVLEAHEKSSATTKCG